MDREIKAKICEDLLERSRLYQPLKRCFQYGMARNNFTVYRINDTESFAQQLFQAPTNDLDNNNQPTSTATASFHSFVQPPPQPARPPRQSTLSSFEDTIVDENGRVCQLCGISYRNRLHKRLYRSVNKCCVCRNNFGDDKFLIQHIEQTIKAKICCECKIGLSDDPEKNKTHFKRHGSKKGNFRANIRVFCNIISKRSKLVCSVSIYRLTCVVAAAIDVLFMYSHHFDDSHFTIVLSLAFSHFTLIRPHKHFITNNCKRK